jgi:hypothetical protein
VPKWVGNSAKRAKRILPRQGSNLRPPSTAKHLNCLTARCNYHCATKNNLLRNAFSIQNRLVNTAFSQPLYPLAYSALNTTLDCSIYVPSYLTVKLYTCCVQFYPFAYSPYRALSWALHRLINLQRLTSLPYRYSATTTLLT